MADGQPLTSESPVRVRDGVAVIEITGPLFRYANVFTAISGATSLEEASRQLGTALADDAIKAIALHVNSPGGQVDGTSEFARLVVAGRKIKPIVPFVSQALSAGYWIASAGGPVVTSDTGMLGSIGVRMALFRGKKSDDTRVEFISSQSPRKNIDPDTDQGARDAQALVDSLATVFVETVAENRGTDVETVLRDFGQGGVFVGAEAVEAGLADSVGTLEEVIQALASAGSDQPSLFTAVLGGASPPLEESMKDNEQGAAAEPTPTKAEQPTPVTAEGLAQSHPEVHASIREAGAQAERERILGVETLAAAHPGHDELVAKAKDEGWSVEKTALTLARAERDAKAAALSDRKADEDALDAPEASSGIEASEAEQALAFLQTAGSPSKN